jgi:hypothetical protein
MDRRTPVRPALARPVPACPEKLGLSAGPSSKTAVDLLLIENRRPRVMFLCVLLGGRTVALTIGLLDVLTRHADAIKSQEKASAGVDLALGLLLLVAGGLHPTSRRCPIPLFSGRVLEAQASRDAG